MRPSPTRGRKPCRRRTGRIAAAAIACLTAGLLFIGSARAETRPAQGRRRAACGGGPAGGARHPRRPRRGLQDSPAVSLPRRWSASATCSRWWTTPTSPRPSAPRSRPCSRRTSSISRSSADDARDPEVTSGFHPVTHDPRVDDAKGVVKEAGDRIVSAKQFFDEQHELREKKALAFNSQWMDVEKSSIMPSGDITFPRNWREKSMRRLKNNLLDRYGAGHPQGAGGADQRRFEGPAFRRHDRLVPEADGPDDRAGQAGPGRPERQQRIDDRHAPPGKGVHADGPEKDAGRPRPDLRHQGRNDLRDDAGQGQQT